MILQIDSINHSIECSDIQSIYSIIQTLQITKSYQWKNGRPVLFGQPIWKAKQQYGDQLWIWTSNQNYIGGSISSNPGFISSAIIAFLLWFILMLTGILPLVARYYAMAFQKLFGILDKLFVWIVGPDDPILFFMRKIAILAKTILMAFPMFFFVWYLTGVWSFLGFSLRYDDCKANYMQNYYGKIIAIVYCLIYVCWYMGTYFIDWIRELQTMPLIGPLANPISNGLNKIYTKLRNPIWIPFYGQIIMSYFTLIGKGIPLFVQMVQPIEQILNNPAQFIQASKQEPFKSLIQQFEINDALKSISYEYLTEQQKSELSTSRSDKITSRFLKWLLINVASVLSGGLWILRSICTNLEIEKLQHELLNIQMNRKMDPAVREQQIQIYESKIIASERNPPLNTECITNTIETGTLTGHLTIFISFVIFIIFLFITPTIRYD